MESDAHVIIVLAHPDDEVFCLHLLKMFANQKRTFIYLTSGTGAKDREIAQVRNSESQHAIHLISHGADILPYGLMFELADGNLAKEFSIEDFTWLLDYFKKHTNPTVLISPALEGGHQDHDAAFLIGKNLSRHWNVKHYSFPLYSSAFFGFPFFRVMKNDFGSIKFKQTIASRSQFLRTALNLMVIYSSQRKTWLGLSLPILIHYTFGSPIYFVDQEKKIASINRFLYESRRKDSRETLRQFEDDFSS
jgi:LmbE family N-acetylglucosaminyl deacetylase